jgi:hypothetical protein
LKNANLRAGPGTNYAIVGGLKTGNKVQVARRNSGGDWLQLRDGKWVASFLVSVSGDVDSLPVAAAPPTPVPPTPGAIPTAAASVPAAPPEPSPVPKAYGDGVADMLNGYGSAIGELYELLTNWEDQPSLVGDSQWRARFMDAIALIRSTGANLRALVPPEAGKSVHAVFVEASTHYDKAANAFELFVVNSDPSQVDGAMEELRTGYYMILEAIEPSE